MNFMYMVIQPLVGEDFRLDFLKCLPSSSIAELSQKMSIFYPCLEPSVKVPFQLSTFVPYNLQHVQKQAAHKTVPCISTTIVCC